MEIANVEDIREDRRRRRGSGGTQLSSKEKDSQNDACFVCHKKGCRPFNCNKRVPEIQNLEYRDSEMINTESENYYVPSNVRNALRDDLVRKRTNGL